WRMASDTARFAALVASLPWTSTPMPISVIQRTRAIKTPVIGHEQKQRIASSRGLNALQTERGPVRVDRDLADRVEAVLRCNRVDDVAAQICAKTRRQIGTGDP